MKQYDVVIIGAGASGLMCAGVAGARGQSVLVLDVNEKPARKVFVAGGGRCNFTNLNVSKENYITENKNFVISALKQFSNQDFIAMVEEYGIPYYEKKDGQLFCKNYSLDIINMLLSEANENGVEIKSDYIVDDVVKDDKGFYYINDNYKTKSLVVATGGISFPDLGATDFGYKIAKQFGLKLIEPRPALVPLMIDGCDNLKGISLNVSIKANKKTFNDDMLFTHFGLSGPVILQITNYWNSGDEIEINLAPDMDIYEGLIAIREGGNKKKLANLLAELLPQRLAEFVAEEFKIDGNILELPNKVLKKIGDRINHWKITPLKTQGFKTAEVTKGGVDTNEVSSKTFECKNHKGLYFIGEVLDVTGQLGGFNLQWAWSSGAVAGNNV